MYGLKQWWFLPTLLPGQGVSPFALCPFHLKIPTLASQPPREAGVREAVAVIRAGLLLLEGTSTYHRSRRCNTSPPGGPRSGSGPGGSWGPALPHTGRGHTLGETEFRGWEQTLRGHAWAPTQALLSFPAGTQSFPELAMLPPLGDRCPSPSPAPPWASHHSCSGGSRSPPGSG